MAVLALVMDKFLVLTEPGSSKLYIFLMEDSNRNRKKKVLCLQGIELLPLDRPIHSQSYPTAISRHGAYSSRRCFWDRHQKRSLALPLCRKEQTG
jgi:hypothetical protein